MRKKQLEEVLYALVGATFLEWREISEAVERAFLELRNAMPITDAMINRIESRLCAEKDQIFKP